ncbi:MAG: hypothetical protein U0361_06370 [Nitrospiraceae bacterium]
MQNDKYGWQSFAYAVRRIPPCHAQAGPERAPSWTADTGKLVEKDGRYVFVETMDPATMLLERAAKQGTISQEESDNVIRESQERSYLV